MLKFLARVLFSYVEGTCFFFFAKQL